MAHNNLKIAEFEELIQKVEDSETSEYLNGRVLGKIKGYYKSLGKCNRLNIWGTAISAILAVLIAYLSTLTVGPPRVPGAIAALGALQGVANACFNFNSASAQAKSVEETIATLKDIMQSYVYNLGVFQDKQRDEKDRLLHEYCEREISAQRRNERILTD